MSNLPKIETDEKINRDESVCVEGVGRVAKWFVSSEVEYVDGIGSCHLPAFPLLFSHE